MGTHQTQNQSELLDLRLRSGANETLVDRQRFSLGAAQWSAFLEDLDRPARKLPKLEILLSKPEIFDESDVTGLSSE